MAIEAAETDDDIHELSAEEARQYFEEAARSLVGMSGEEFIRGYQSGYWLDPDEDGNVMYLALLRHIVR